MTLEFDHIFEAITQDSAQAFLLQTRSDLMIIIRDIIASNSLDLRTAARAMCINQAVLVDLINGRIEKFTIDKLIGCLFHLGFTFKPIYKDGELIISVHKLGETVPL
ncbi:XRE family transcriptional regulator [Bowmanella sp. Y26]|uniref:helix-turn-helix domain-containing protein n=1 Tax=Bowmanella yangjiangensis TaxID=2811230 RepID=UPI001BDCF42A|nr:XRE family transcriptional regulator [Bowmanella yangjiangensis]MBT1063987.1 XRE family transcriptional regulator [Bowmanella yangjiangensis]